MPNQFGTSQYVDKMRKMAESGKKRLIVNVDHVKAYNEDLYNGLLSVPVDYVPPFEQAVNELMQTLQTTVPEPGMEAPMYYIGFEGDFGDHKMSPRTLASEHLGQMVFLEALVTRCQVN